MERASYFGPLGDAAYGEQLRSTHDDVFRAAPRPFSDLYTISQLADHVGLSEEALAVCDGLGLRTVAQVRRLARQSQALQERSGCSAAIAAEVLRLLAPPGRPIDWPAPTDALDRVAQQIAHLPSRAQNGIALWLTQNKVGQGDPWDRFLWCVHSATDLHWVRGVGPGTLTVIEAWRSEMRARYPMVGAEQLAAAAQGPQEVLAVEDTELDLAIRRSLRSFGELLVSKQWYGKRREAVSYYAFGFLLKECRAGTVLHAPAQVAVPGRVPADIMRWSTEVSEDLVIWQEAGGSCWDSSGRCTRYPLAIMAWKGSDQDDDPYDLAHLQSITLRSPGLIGYAVTFHADKRDTLRAARVMHGAVLKDWLLIGAGH